MNKNFNFKRIIQLIFAFSFLNILSYSMSSDHKGGAIRKKPNLKLNLKHVEDRKETLRACREKMRRKAAIDGIHYLATQLKVYGIPVDINSLEGLSIEQLNVLSNEKAGELAKKRSKKQKSKKVTFREGSDLFQVKEFNQVEEFNEEIERPFDPLEVEEERKFLNEMEEKLYRDL